MSNMINSIWLTLPEYLMAFAGLIGLVVGSFLNVLVARYPRMLEVAMRDALEEEFGVDAGQRLGLAPISEERRRENLAFPGSRCPACGAKIRWWHNIPVLGFILLKGRCADCDVKISWRYPLVELCTGMLFMGILQMFGPTLLTLAWWAAISLVIGLTLIDHDEYLLPDVLVVPLLALGLLVALESIGPVHIADAAYGALTGWGVFWLVSLAVPLGEGDHKYAAAIGAWTGLSGLFVAIFVASVLFVIGATWKARRDASGVSHHIAFGPWLSVGLIAAIYGRELIV